MLTQFHRFKIIFWVGTFLTLIVAIGLTYFNMSNEDNLLSREFILSSVYLFLHLCFSIVSIVIFIVVVFLLSETFSKTDFIDDWLLFKVRKSKDVLLWLISLTFLLFCITIGKMLFHIWIKTPEYDFFDILSYLNGLMLPGITSLIGLIILFKAKLEEPIKFSSSLAERISPELIVRHRESAVREAFVFFEERLRQKLNLSNEDQKKPGAIDLINKAFGKNGLLKSGQNEGNRDLMAGIVEKYRNPLSHKPVDMDKQTATTILFLIDDFVRIVDESELNDET